MTVEQKRRELFEAFAIKEASATSQSYIDFVLKRYSSGAYVESWADTSWIAFNAALDAVEIELPILNNSHLGGADSVYGPSIEQVEDAGFDYGVKACRAAIESTGLGLKVKL